MANLNEVRLIGRLTRNPEMKTTMNGQMVTTFGLATGRKYKGADGVLKEETTFVDITCWARLAETVYNNLRKGRQIFVAGRLKFDSWDDKETGKRRSKLSVVADNVQFLDPKDSAGPQGVPGQQPQGYAPAPNYNNPPAPNYNNPPASSAPQDEWAPPAPADDFPAPNSNWNDPPMDEPPF